MIQICGFRSLQIYWVSYTHLILNKDRIDLSDKKSFRLFIHVENCVPNDVKPLRDPPVCKREATSSAAPARPWRDIQLCLLQTLNRNALFTASGRVGQ